MPTAVSQPLSSSARPAEARRTDASDDMWRRFAGATFLLVREKELRTASGRKTYLPSSMFSGIELRR
eukprot:3118633-Prymnesium_polylepis.1